MAKSVSFCILAAAVVAALAAVGAELVIPHRFIPNTDAIAEHVNENFDEIARIVNNLDSSNIATGAVGSQEIMDGAIVDADVAAAANINPAKISWPQPTPGNAVVGNVRYLDGHTAQALLNAAKALISGGSAATGGIVTAFEIEFAAGNPSGVYTVTPKPLEFWQQATPKMPAQNEIVGSINVVLPTHVPRYQITMRWKDGRPSDGFGRVFEHSVAPSGFKLDAWMRYSGPSSGSVPVYSRPGSYFFVDHKNVRTYSAVLQVIVTRTDGAAAPTISYTSP